MLHREKLTVDVATEGAPDADGVPTKTTEPVTVAGFNIQPVISFRGAEEVDNQLLVTKRWKVSGPPVPGLTAASRIEWRGDFYQPWGDVGSQHYSVLPHAEFYIVAWEG